MLNEVQSQHRRCQTFRLAVVPNGGFLRELDLDDQGQREMMELLSSTGRNPHLEEICDAPFRRSRHLKRVTRFSDGSFPVFYSSLEVDTAKAEVRHWIPCFIGQPKGIRTTYYHNITCTFDGVEKDIRHKVHDWPDLMHDNDYRFCNQLGAEAVRLKLDGLVTPSVRLTGGTNLPILSRGAVSKPQLLGVLIFTFDPKTGQVTFR